MSMLGSFIITIVTNVLFYRWYTGEIAKEIRKIEERVDKKLLSLIRKNH